MASTDQDRRDRASFALMREAVLRSEVMYQAGKPAADIEAYMVAATVVANDAKQAVDEAAS